MGLFKTDRLALLENDQGNYTVTRTAATTVETKAHAVGGWRSRPRGSRFLTDDQIRTIRASTAASRHLAEIYDCSHMLIYYIKKRAIYSDVI